MIQINWNIEIEWEVLGKKIGVDCGKFELSD
jgi:hypothetical protein